ncbi:MAG: BlaI/MecI/CopY family transcriptional regulator [Aphanocapsa lilacina HA4352-LM1]|uniref:BlaI/MecI/CopY family transcriptional regulator n=1 Tax=Gloeobacter morelensis MG652769 TaxID=2781736 RepID=A0ABY3PGE5_9CYAN|nr:MULTISPECIES: BlaI/MecI/CopY family transcriptional regulator [Gloeobacter]MBW4698798.1 BlaI/MecI/CopY family transcriptional regulator [Aphanocapsa lilacina HA4352-LM1]UFP92709.1 BlaI/MecI/CopY family transcriptional regulator [Gloeobacter morelensis MG652769]
MARKRSPTLTESELRLMEILWQRGSATVAEVVEALPKRLSLAYSTVLTTLRILEQKGYVRHTEEGRAFVYCPLVDRNQARRSAVEFVLSRFFNNSPELLMLNILEHEDIDAAELERLRTMIQQNDPGEDHEQR